MLLVPSSPAALGMKSLIREPSPAFSHEVEPRAGQPVARARLTAWGSRSMTRR